MANGKFSHSEGDITKSHGLASHSEGRRCESNGEGSHAEGISTLTTNDGEHAEGTFNVSHRGKTIHSVGIGSEAKRRNAMEIMNDGHVFIHHIGDYDGIDCEQAKSLQEILSDILLRLNRIEEHIYKK